MMNIKNVNCFIILGELDFTIYPEANYIYKYQSAENILTQLIEYYAQVEEIFFEQTDMLDAQMIGFYSPIKRCCQSTMAFELAKELAKQEPTLYLNFENYIGIPGLLKPGRVHDLSDLLYFLEHSKEQFFYRLQSMAIQIDRLDYIPPMFPSNNLIYITIKQWISLFQEIRKQGKYKYIVLDLNDNMQGIFEILRMCSLVYTMVLDDKIAEMKLKQYKQLLQLCEYEDILSKTEQRKMPIIKEISEEFTEFTKKEVYHFINLLIKKEIRKEDDL